MPSPITRALVLTAGLGTRLRPLTLVRAKPAIPLAGEPLVSRIIRWLVAAGVDELVLNLHYRPESIARVVGDGRHLGAAVRYSWEQPAVLGSAGGPRLAAPIVTAGLDPDAPFLLVNGDTLTDVDLSALSAAHQQSGALVTMALTPNVEPDRYGGVRLSGDGVITGFAPRGPAAAGSYHFVGVQVASAAAFAAVAAGAFASSVGEVYDRLLAERPGCLRGFVQPAQFWDIGSVADYWRTSQAFAAAADGAPHATLGRGHDLHVDPGASLDACIVWDRVTIGAGASLHGCIVTDDVTVPAGASYRDAILRCDPAQGLIVDRRPLE